LRAQAQNLEPAQQPKFSNISKIPQPSTPTTPPAKAQTLREPPPLAPPLLLLLREPLRWICGHVDPSVRPQLANFFK
jgi:hypothetical protein